MSTNKSAKQIGKKYYIITIGCQMNVSDSERLAGFLDDLGYGQAVVRSEADLVIINTCGVRHSAESRIYGLVPQIRKENNRAKIVITGCLVGRQDVQRSMADKVDLWLPIKNMTDLAGFLTLGQDDKLPSSYLKIAPKYNSKISAYVPIGTGCDNFCTYCVVPYARGREVYRPASEIIAEAEALAKGGYQEITLIAQNVNSYKDGQLDFADLLLAIDALPGSFWLRFATSHPKDMSDKLIEAIASCRKCCHHIHLPAQAGDDDILSRMNRKYTNVHYQQLLTKIRTALPDVSLTSDIIVGFPGETDEQFKKTLDLAVWARYDNIYIGKYSPRPYTVAAGFVDDVSRQEKKSREERLLAVLRQTALANHQAKIGRQMEVLFEKAAKGFYLGRAQDNTAVKVAIGDNINLLGRIVAVKIIAAHDFGLDGAIIK